MILILDSNNHKPIGKITFGSVKIFSIDLNPYFKILAACLSKNFIKFWLLDNLNNRKQLGSYKVSAFELSWV